jgi:hypothetical protein
MGGRFVMDIFEIKHQKLSTLLSVFMICTSCKIVDNDTNRIEVGYKCPKCGIAGDGARDYFPMSVHSLIDLMQEFYHLKQESGEGSEVPKFEGEDNHKLAVVILFCTLVEVLLQHFLECLMSSMELSHKIQERLLNDNISIRQRVEKLFPTLIGAKWRKTIKKLNEHVELNYIEAIEFHKYASEKRNFFLHRGSKWAIPKNMPKKCIQQIWPIINLFVSLHNEFIAQPI